MPEQMTEEKFAQLVLGKSLTDIEMQVLRKSFGLPTQLPDFLANPTTGMEKALFKATLMGVWANKMG